MLKTLLNAIRKYRINILIRNGLKLGNNVYIGNSVIIDVNFPWLIKIGNDCTITSRVIILAHDASTKRHIGYTKVGRVDIGNKVFVGMGSIILPDVTIGDNAIIGAGSVVTKNVPANHMVAGSPAKVIGKTADYIKKHQKLMNDRPVYYEDYILPNISTNNKLEMQESLLNGIGYIV